MEKRFLYAFRFCCDPAFNGEQALDELCGFIQDAGIDDVIVFANAQELNTGHMTGEEQELWLGYIRKVKQRVEPMGCTVSINHWNTYMHADLGRKPRPGQNFAPMVDVEGHAAAICACPVGQAWRDYYEKLCAEYAQTQPFTLWVEDDFRLHNHEPLVWGGCFCEEHMRLYSERAGKRLTREEFLAGVLQPGEPHPYRKIWLDVSRETMVENARRIGAAVHSRAPRARVGLMSSAPSIHAAEGRDWAGILKGLSGPDVPCVDRVHLPGYIETIPSRYLCDFNAVSMLTRAFLPEGTEVYPELENFPFTLFSSSRRFTRFQLLSALPLDMAGITIDLYELSGSGVDPQEGYEGMLREAKGYLQAMTELGVFHLPAAGVRVMVSPDSSYTLHTSEGKHMEELYPAETLFASLLPAYGIPMAYCTDPGVQGQVVAISGQYLRNLSAGQVEALFQNNFVILDGAAAETLFQMGLGHLANLEDMRWMPMHGGEFSFEQVADGRLYRGKACNRASTLFWASDALDIRYGAGAQPITQFCDAFRQPTAPALALAKPGVLVLPYGHYPDWPSLPRALFHTLRQAVFQQALRGAQGVETPPFLVGEPYLEPYYYHGQGADYLYVLNAALDPCAQLVLEWGDRPLAGVQAYASTGSGWQAVPFERKGSQAVLQCGLPSMEAVLLRLDGAAG